jgi:hypothetical protein
LSAGAAAAALELAAGPTYGVDFELDDEDGFLDSLTPTGTSGTSVGDAAAALELEGGPTYGVVFELDAEDDMLIPLDVAPTGTTDLSLLDIAAAAAADDDAAACLPLFLLLPLTTPPAVIEFTGPAISSLLMLLGFLADASLGTGTCVGSPIFIA